ncbi:MAG: PKD domain-containing protein, partial [Bacteroidota bacterium]
STPTARDACENKPFVRKPKAEFTYQSLNCEAPFRVQFTNLSKRGDFYHWDFGDGTISSEESPEHVYEAPGTYRVVLTVTNENEKSEQKEETLILGALPLGATANFGYNILNCAPPYDVQLYPVWRDAQGYRWFIDSNHECLEKSPTLAFPTQGSYTVRLQTWHCGDTLETSKTITLNLADTGVEADFKIITSSDEGNNVWYTGANIKFDNRSRRATDFEWLINGDFVSDNRDFQHRFEAEGIYDITLVAICNDYAVEITRTVEIRDFEPHSMQITEIELLGWEAFGWDPNDIVENCPDVYFAFYRGNTQIGNVTSTKSNVEPAHTPEWNVDFTCTNLTETYFFVAWDADSDQDDQFMGEVGFRPSDFC